MLEFNNLTVFNRLRTINAILPLRELHAITGPNGSGKSTLLKAIAGVQPLDGGVISLNGIDVATHSRRDRSRLITYIPQAYHTPYPFTVEEMVGMALYASGGTDALISESLDRAHASPLRHKAFSALSTGEKQRVLIARGLATQASVMLFDEPTANLDRYHRAMTWELMETLVQEGKTILVASHDWPSIRQRCSQCLLIEGGALMTMGSAETVLKSLEEVSLHSH